MSSWKERLIEEMPEDWAREIDLFEGQMELVKQGKLDEKVFAETRLRRGAYGQRYDNGQRHDGIATQTLEFPNAYVKGPDTLWDAPGMMRIKIPFGGLTPPQLEVLGQLATEYADDILHVTTRQDIQFHYIHIEDAPDIMRRLAAVGITTLEACGNSIRNITCCQFAGVCQTEAFDATPYANALAFYLLGHDDVQDFGRKFKIAFSGCAGEACGLVRMHDLGFLARQKTTSEGEVKNGFALFVGGGLGTVPHQAELLYEFVPEEEILPVTQAVCRIFARYGEKKNRNRARVKFLVAKLGIEEFRRLVDEEYAVLPEDERWTAYLDELEDYGEQPSRPPVHLNGQARPEGFEEWYLTNIRPQKQENYTVVTINLPLGDFTAKQSFQLADVARKYAGGNVRLTVEQNVVLRWVAEADLPALYSELKAIGLGIPGAGTIVDITTCPGTDTCKLGIASSRGLAGKLRTDLTIKNTQLPQAIKDLKIKVSGCFNSCGQHHIADIGFFGNSRRVGNRKVPHFQVILGGEWKNNAGSYGLAVGAVPSKSVPDVLDAITNSYVDGREPQESFQNWIGRLGKKNARAIIQPFMTKPDYESQPQFFTDWGDPREYTIGDIGVGECAGEVISLFAFEIAKAESLAFEAQITHEEGAFAKADQQAYQAMILAARALVRTQFLDVGDDPENIVQEFKTRFYDTQLFFDRYARGKFGRYLLERHDSPNPNPDAQSAHRLIEEALLFIEAAYACDERVNVMAAV